MNKRIEKFIKEHTDSEGLIFIKATNDILFKALFGYKGNECFLEDFLEAYYNLELVFTAILNDKWCSHLFF